MKEDKTQQIADLLKVYKPGFLPYPIFEQIARLVALPILEFIPLRKTTAGVEVLLIQRPENDPLWPGMLHTPGTVIRATDINKDHNTNWPAAERIVNDELKGTKIGHPHFAGSQLHTSKRGVEQAQIYWVEVEGEPRVGKFYGVNNLPETLIDSQISFITLVTNNYQAWLNQKADTK